jgi:type I site-specific restriction endonuclease
MELSESDTWAKLIDPALRARGWTVDFIRREETAGAIEIVDRKPSWVVKSGAVSKIVHGFRTDPR